MTRMRGLACASSLYSLPDWSSTFHYCSETRAHCSAACAHCSAQPRKIRRARKRHDTECRIQIFKMSTMCKTLLKLYRGSGRETSTAKTLTTKFGQLSVPAYFKIKNNDCFSAADEGAGRQARALSVTWPLLCGMCPLLCGMCPLLCGT